MPSLLNYITSPDVLIWSAVQASCALPGFFSPVTLYAKNHKGEIKPWDFADCQWIDGSVVNDIPLKRLSEMFNVNHFIVSQVNPHVNPSNMAMSIARSFSPFWKKLFTLITMELHHRMKQLYSLGICQTLFYFILNVIQQPYSGDITIFPELSMRDVFSMMANFDLEKVPQAHLKGLRAAWPSTEL